MPLSLPHTQLPPVHQNDSHSPPSYNMQLSHTHVHTRRPQTPRSPSHNSRTSSFFPFPTIRTAALPLGVCWQLLRAPPLPAAPGPNASCPLRPEARTTAPGQTPAAAPPLPRAQPMHVRGPGSPAPPAPSSLRSAPRVTFAGPGPRTAPGPRGPCSEFASRRRPAEAAARPRARHGEAEAGPARYLPAARGRRAAGPTRPPAPREQAAPPPPRAGPYRSATPAPEPLRPPPVRRPRETTTPRQAPTPLPVGEGAPASPGVRAPGGPARSRPALGRLGLARLGLRPEPPRAGRRRPQSPPARALRAPPAAPTCWEPPSRRPPPGPPSSPPTSRYRGRSPTLGPPPTLSIGCCGHRSTRPALPGRPLASCPARATLPRRHWPTRSPLTLQPPASSFP